MTRVVNIKTDKCDIYIGRPSEFCNPFIIGRNGTREEVIAQYKDYFYRRIEYDKLFLGRVLALKDKILGCYCKPLACHGDIIAGFLNKGEEKW